MKNFVILLAMLLIASILGVASCDQTSSYSGSLMYLREHGDILRANDHSEIIYYDDDGYISRMEAKAVRRLTKLYRVHYLPASESVHELTQDLDRFYIPPWAVNKYKRN